MNLEFLTEKVGDVVCPGVRADCRFEFVVVIVAGGTTSEYLFFREMAVGGLVPPLGGDDAGFPDRDRLPAATVEDARDLPGLVRTDEILPTRPVPVYLLGGRARRRFRDVALHLVTGALSSLPRRE